MLQSIINIFPHKRLFRGFSKADYDCLLFCCAFHTPGCWWDKFSLWLHLRGERVSRWCEKMSQGSYQSVKICKKIHHLHHRIHSFTRHMLKSVVPTSITKKKFSQQPFIVIFRFCTSHSSFLSDINKLHMIRGEITLSNSVDWIISEYKWEYRYFT